MGGRFHMVRDPSIVSPSLPGVFIDWAVNIFRLVSPDPQKKG